MTTVSRFPRQNDAGLRALAFVLWRNLVLIVVFVLEFKVLSDYLRGYFRVNTEIISQLRAVIDRIGKGEDSDLVEELQEVH